MPLRLLMVSLIAFLASQTVAAQPKDHPSEYATLVAQLQSGKTDIDYTRLRLSYMDSPEYQHAQDTSAPEKAMMIALQKKDFAEAIEQAEKVLANDYTSISAHMADSLASERTGNTQQAKLHRAVCDRLIDSIRKSGDGKSTKTAWVVISVHEEYVLLHILGYAPSEQSLIGEHGHSYDVMKVKKLDDGTEQTFYFNTDIPMKHGGL
jgi:hypothetical protein